ncbi:hypothetical protein PTTG_25460 [Puccinia triticina 1-1 BBBD Race 1]|uniref:Uncharacterized protein n=1 Tax=Puccinia triticina (isolate 1-1 / race 1 (BBBD)) TaxID=630390 RepID=A0A180H2U4_PUCT1|nr:hypothetical protein PTTG_25460 [Puccinia triticina 1-1 BBBD Race 1]
MRLDYSFRVYAMLSLDCLALPILASLPLAEKTVGKRKAHRIPPKMEVSEDWPSVHGSKLAFGPEARQVESASVSAPIQNGYGFKRVKHEGILPEKSLTRICTSKPPSNSIKLEKPSIQAASSDFQSSRQKLYRDPASKGKQAGFERIKQEGEEVGILLDERKYRPVLSEARIPGDSSAKPKKLESVEQQTISISEHPTKSPAFVKDEKIGLFTVEDWDFVRENPETSHHQKVPQEFLPENLFGILKNSLSPPQGSGAFHIPENKEFIFFAKYRRATRSNIKFPQETKHETRKCALFSTVYDHSIKRIDFDSYPLYSEGIITKLTAELNKRAKDSIHTISRLRIDGVIKTVAETTKVATFLIILYLSLFREHKQNIVTRRVVEDILAVVSELWRSLSADNVEPGLTEEFEWASGLVGFLNTGLTSSFRWAKCPAKMVNYNISWNIVEYWTTRSLKMGKDGVMKKRYYSIHLAQLLDKIILCLNYQTIAEITRSNPKNPKRLPKDCHLKP